MGKTSRRTLVEMADELALRRARQSLRCFAEWAWPILHPDTVFLPNWHIDFVCEHLEAVTAGEILRLVINIPPRYIKSLLVSVLWPCWEWIQRPSGRWLFTSYAETLASRHSLDRRRILRSAPYRRLAPDIHLSREQQGKLEFHNSKGGIMLATSIGGSVTGTGGNRLILDDPHSPTQADSDVQRMHAIDFFNYTLSTRLDNPAKDAVVLIMQRLHTADLTARCLELGYAHVCLPAIAPVKTTVVFPRTGLTHVREADSALWPARENRDQLEDRRVVLGSYGFAGQYQQEPVPRIGGMFSRDWWGWYDVLPGPFHEVLQSWDLSFNDGDDNDYVVGLVAGRIGPKVYLLARFRAKVTFVETLDAIRQMVARFPVTRTILIEDAANGAAVVNVLREQIPGIIAVRPQGSKFGRAAAVQPQLEAGQVFLPRPRDLDGHIRSEYFWAEDFVETCAVFPKGEHDDDVDALTQLLLRPPQPGGMSMSDIIRYMTRDDEKSGDDDDAEDDDEDPRGGGNHGKQF